MTALFPNMLPMTPVRQPLGPDGLHLVAGTPRWLQEWQALEERLESTHLSNSAAWTRIWIAHYGSLVPHHIAVFTQNDDIAGMCLLTEGVDQREGPFAVRTLHVGTAGEPESESICVEYNHLLTSPGHLSEFARQLMAVAERHGSAQSFVLDGMAAVEAQAFIGLKTPTDVDARPSYYCNLDLIRTAPLEPWRLFGVSTRSNLRRSLRELGDIELDWADTVDQALTYYEEMIDYHCQRWNASGKPGVFSCARFSAFHRDLLAALIPCGRAVIVRARQGTRVLGILYLMIEDNRLLYYQSGLPEHTSKLSLGNVTQYLTMLEGARRGYDAFDFMAGEAQYKRVLSTHHNMLYWVKWRKPSVKLMVLDGLRTIKKYLNEL